MMFVAAAGETFWKGGFDSFFLVSMGIFYNIRCIHIIVEQPVNEDSSHQHLSLIHICSGQYSLIIINASFPLAQACTLYIEDNELTR